MRGPCLCGDPYCGRCYSDPQAEECGKCGGPITRSELPDREIWFNEDTGRQEITDYPGSPNIIIGDEAVYHLVCPGEDT